MGHGRKAVSLAPGSIRPLLFCTLGMAFFWQLLRNRNYTELVPDSLTSLYLIVPSLVLIALLISLNISEGSRRRISDLRISVTSSLVSSLLLLILDLARSLMPGATDLACGLALACFVVVPFALVGLLMCWARILEGVSQTSNTVLILILLISELLGLFISYLFFYPLRSPALTMVVSPACSACCLLLSRDRVERDEAAADQKVATLKGFIAFFSVMLVVSIVASGVISSGMSYTGDSHLLMKHLITLVELLVLIALFFFASNTETWAYLVWVGVTCILICGLMLFGSIEHPYALSIGSSVISTSRCCLEVLLLIALIVGRPADREPQMFYSIGFLLPMVLGGLLGYSIIPTRLATQSIADGRWLSAFSLGAGFVLIVCVIVLLTKLSLKGMRRASADQQEPGMEQMLDQQAALAGISHDYALTERETQMLGYVFRGYTLKRIAEMECLSVNTVRSHTKTLYLKLGLHSRQEIIDLVEERQREI